MTLQWLGHACYLLTASNGRTLLMDPFDESVGYPMPEINADVVTCSHNHHDHYGIDRVHSGYTLIKQPGEHHTQGFVIEGITSFHDDEGGIKRGRNIIYLVQIDGLRIAHLGDIGHLLTQAQIEKLSNVDVLLVPVGGFYTVDADQAAAIVRSITPRIAIPMHYKTKYIDSKKNPIEDETAFAAQFTNIVPDTNTLTITPGTLDDYPEVVVLSC